MFLLCGKEGISLWCTEIACWQTNLPLYRAEFFVPNLLIIRDQIPRCKRRQTYQNVRLLGIYQVCSNDCMHKWISLLWTEYCARSVFFTFHTFSISFLNKKLWFKILYSLPRKKRAKFWAINQIFPNKDARNLMDRHPPTDTSIPASVK